MIFLKRWFAYNKSTQGEMHGSQEYGYEGLVSKEYPKKFCSIMMQSTKSPQVPTLFGRDKEIRNKENGQKKGYVSEEEKKSLFLMNDLMKSLS